MDGVRDDDRFRCSVFGVRCRCSVFGVGVGVINLCHFHPVLSIAASGFLEMNIQLGPQLVVRSLFSERPPDRRATALRICELLSVASRPGRLRPSVGVSA
jgi:hypothetical protein